MDKVIEAARYLGRIMQEDERYIRYNMTQMANDGDAELQKMIEEFNLKRGELTQETQKKDKDSDRIKALDDEVRSLYTKIFENENMAAFTEARGEMQSMMEFINHIISGSSNGMNPDAIEMESSGCGGSCNSCSGCG